MELGLTLVSVTQEQYKQLRISKKHIRETVVYVAIITPAWIKDYISVFLYQYAAGINKPMIIVKSKSSDLPLNITMALNNVTHKKIIEIDDTKDITGIDIDSITNAIKLMTDIVKSKKVNKCPSKNKGRYKYKK